MNWRELLLPKDRTLIPWGIGVLAFVVGVIIAAALLTCCGGRLVADVVDAADVDPCSMGPGCISVPDAGPSPR